MSWFNCKECKELESRVKELERELKQEKKKKIYIIKGYTIHNLLTNKDIVIKLTNYIRN